MNPGIVMIKGSNWYMLKKQRMILTLPKEMIRESLVSPESNNRIS